jgi:hypothetical protein
MVTMVYSFFEYVDEMITDVDEIITEKMFENMFEKCTVGTQIYRHP